MKGSLVLLLLSFTGLIQAQDLVDITLVAKELAKKGQHVEAIELLATEIDSYQKLNGISPSLIQAVMVQGKSSIYQWKWEDAKQFYVRAMEMSSDINNDSLFVENAFETLTVYSFLNEFNAREKLAKELLLRDDINVYQKSDLFTIMAGISENAEKLDSAIYYATKAAEIDSIHQDSSSLPFTYYDLGNYYISSFNYEAGISKILYGLSFLRGEIDSHKKANMEIGLGNVYFNIGNISKAKSLTIAAVEFSQKADLHVTQTKGYSLLGDCEKYLENYNLALDYYMKSDSVNAIKINNRRRANRAKINIINTKLELGITISEEELIQLKEIRKTTEVTSFKNRIDLVLMRVEDYSISEFEEKYNLLYSKSYLSSIIHLKLALLKIKKEFYQKKGLYQKAFEANEQLDSLNKDILQRTNNFAIQELDAKYLKDKQDTEIQYLDDQNKIQTKLVSQQRKLLGFGTLALALISFLSFFLFRLFKRAKKQKELIAKTLSEKDILLREIHHRVKNNLQLVSSLLTMQGRSINDVKALEAINEGKSRVRSMALIHQDLYNKENLTGISVKEYIEKLTTELFMTYRIDQGKINLIMNIEDIELDVDTMVPLGLIINELITNSLKYAFPEGNKGELRVSLNEIEGKLRLQVSDNGIGYDVGNVEKESFGSTLVNALTEQLDGELKTSTTNGTTTEIYFSDFSQLP